MAHAIIPQEVLLPSPAPVQLFTNPKAQALAQNSRWTPQTIFYRYMKKKRLLLREDGSYAIRPNPVTDATLRDIYAARMPRREASELKQLTLNVSSAEAFYKIAPLSNEEVVVAMSLSDMIKLGALPYPDVGTSLMEPYVFSFPSEVQEVPVTIYR